MVRRGIGRGRNGAAIWQWVAGVIFSAAVVSGWAAAANGVGMVTVTLAEDTEAVLHNPDMGWVLYENYPLDQRPGGASTLVNFPDETFPEANHVALMFAWSDVEVEPGRYDWSKVDFAYDYWRKRGKQIQLRMSTESLLWWTNVSPPSGLGVPKYVLDRMGKDKVQVRECEGIPYTLVDARDAYYRERLERFLAETRAHFDSSRPVTLVDLRAFGLWGEWHTGYQYPTIQARRDALTGIIDRFAAAFPHHYVALSASYDPDSPKSYWAGPIDRYDEGSTATYRDFLWFSAFDHALTKPNVTFRRDGVGGAVHSNERKLIAEHVARFRGPVMAEFMDGYESSKKGGDRWLRWKLDDALSVRPNYINLLGYQAGDALAFTKERPDLVAKGLREMGYRLVPVEVVYPRVAGVGEWVEVGMTWVNRGAGRCLRDYSLTVELAEVETGTVRCRHEAGPVETSAWLKGGRYRATTRFVAGLAEGEYVVRVGLMDPVTRVKIALPLEGQTSDGSYVVGRIRCSAAAR